MEINFTSALKLAMAFPEVRDIFSLFPRNKHIKTLLSQVCYLTNGEDAKRLRRDCKGKRIIVVTNCESRLDDYADVRATYECLSKDDYHLITLLGVTSFENETSLSCSYDGQILRVPVSDDYEHLHRKLFYAFMLLDLLTKHEMVIKIDDDLMLEDASTFTKCMDRSVRKKGQLGRQTICATESSRCLHDTWQIDRYPITLRLRG